MDFQQKWIRSDRSEVLLYLFVVTGVVFLLSVGSILPRSSPSLLFVWLMLLARTKGWALVMLRPLQPQNISKHGDCPQIVQIPVWFHDVFHGFPICNTCSDHGDCRIFSLAAIAYGLVITTFFTRAKTAATVGSILFYTTSFLTKAAGFSCSEDGRL